VISAILFWLSLASIFYAYVGYLLVLKVLSFFLSKPVRKEPSTPSVTLIISAYNEEHVIAEKIENSLALDYPKEMMEIMVVSDASSDRTEEIAKSYTYSGVKTLRVEGRVGKTSCLNRAIPLAKGDIIIFSDANSVYHKNAVREMVANFADSTVGCVTGYTKYLSASNNTSDESIGIYARLERTTKRLESIIGSCVGADGAIFAIRKDLYSPLKTTDINDFVIPLNIVGQRYRTVLEERAWCHEETAKDIKGEFARQVRITNRTLRAIFNNRYLLNIFEHGNFSFELFSHKVLKFLVPLFLAVALLCNLILTRIRWMYRPIFILHILLYSMAALNIRLGAGNLEKIKSSCRAFIIVNAAILNGWITYLKGEDFTTWKIHR